jgi:hypothetical protein
MDVRSHPCESSKRHCSAGAGPDRQEKGVVWADLLDDRGINCGKNKRSFESAIRKRFRRPGEGRD